MSLRVWLPLTKDLRQQGLSNITITNSGATYSATGGKLGGCYVFDGSDDSIGIGNLSTLVNTDFTFACWFYHDNTWSSKGYETLLGGPSGFELESKVSTTNSPVLKLYNWGGGSCIYELNKWNHVVFTRNTTETKLYLNGELQVTGTAGTIPSGDYFIGAWKTSAQQNFKGNMNDVRIYDHCLSPMEVKELAKGLVLHYPLNRQGWGQDNLVNNSDFSNLATSGYVIKDTTVLFHGKPTCKINRTGATSNTYTGWSSQNLFSRLTPGSKVTVSVWVYRDSNHGIDSGCEWRMYQRYNNDASTDWTGFYSSANWPIGEWKQFKYTYTIRNDISSAYLNFNVVKNGTYWLAEPKVEIGEAVTPWCPSLSDTLYTTMGLNSTTEYDCSGFCNNGTRTGTFSWTSDTPKYNVSQVFSGSQYIVEPNEINTTDSTIALWIKSPLSANAHVLDARNSSEVGKQPIYQYTNGSIQTGGSNAYVTTNTGLLVANTWMHIALVQSGNSLLVYKNGTLFQTLSCNNSPIIKPTIGARLNFSNKWTGQLSDVRIYATALSADDVKSLYQNCATIDPDGTIHGQIRN